MGAAIDTTGMDDAITTTGEIVTIDSISQVINNDNLFRKRNKGGFQTALIPFSATPCPGR
ncbi:hypothetical protein [Chlorobium limicola]|uniref:Uncharacterized protein n=2 Tax=Chlorobium limicola TaxID=1092 RepID=A0A117MR34_CHLLI|nr:hypothetical protein [Chlorobium limicola]ACD90599.1 hypothetical protein Clim_1550 [Chlorobium limicola DSM 245]KUL31197.1 hypothetical protein ASB62_03285 [Chlorobium limicola]